MVKSHRPPYRTSSRSEGRGLNKGHWREFYLSSSPECLLSASMGLIINDNTYKVSPKTHNTKPVACYGDDTAVEAFDDCIWQGLSSHVSPKDFPIVRRNLRRPHLASSCRRRHASTNKQQTNNKQTTNKQQNKQTNNKQTTNKKQLRITLHAKKQDMSNKLNA